MSDKKYYKRTIVKKELDSKYLEETRTLRIFLPPGYNELQSYPVIYCQDGEQFFNFGKIATHATRLILDENMEPMIIVGVDVNLKQRTEEYHAEGKRFTAYCDFFIHEMIPYVKDQFPVRSEKEHVVLAGDSLGGTVSLHLALDRPDLFSKVLSLSGAFFDSTQERIREESDWSGLDIYMLIGLEEEDVKTDRGTFDFVQMNRRTKKLLEERNTKLHYVEKPGKHVWGFWQDELPEALNYFFAD